MDKTIDSDFNLTDVRLFLEQITPAQMETVLGGYCQPCRDYPDIGVSILRKGINKVKKTYEGGGSDKDNKINSIDNSKKTYINGLLMDEKS